MTGRLLTVDHALDAWKIKERPGNNDEEASTAMITRHFQEKFIHLLDQAVVSFLAAVNLRMMNYRWNRYDV